MSDYKSMYYSLFNSISDAIELLKESQVRGEQMFIEDEEEQIVLPGIKSPDIEEAAE